MQAQAGGEGGRGGGMLILFGLREMDPDAARRFERERKTPPTRDEPETR